MADVQLERGHLRIANDLWEAWFRADLGRNELRVLGVIVRLSYGWDRTDTGDAASFRRLQSDTGLGSRAVSDGIRRLLQKGVIRRLSTGSWNHAVSVYEVVKDYDAWSPATLPETWRPEALPQTEVLPHAEVLPPTGTETTSARGSILEPRENQEEEDERAQAGDGMSWLAEACRPLSNSEAAGSELVDEVLQSLGAPPSTRGRNYAKWAAVAKTDPAVVRKIARWAAEDPNPVSAFLRQWVDGEVRETWLRERPRRSSEQRTRTTREQENAELMAVWEARQRAKKEGRA